jgi:hypothetical protein
MITLVNSQNASEVKVASLYQFSGTEQEYDKVVNWFCFRRSRVGPSLYTFHCFELLVALAVIWQPLACSG